MAKKGSRVSRERRTIGVMIRMFCRDKHGSRRGALCPECSGLSAYALQRIDKCPFLADKPTCLKCPVHCYRPDARESVRAVMRHSGPRMIREHPYLAVRHLIDGWMAGRAARDRKAATSRRDSRTSE